METTSERPHLQRGLPGRGVSPIDWLRIELARRLSNPHPSTSPAAASKAPCGADPQALSETRRPLKSQATFPIPSGHILRGRRINRSDPGRPAVPTPSSGSVSGRSRRQFYPAVPAPSTHPHHRGPPDRQPTSARPSRQQSSLTPQAGAARPRKESRALDRPHASPISAHPPAVQTDSCPF